MARYIGFFVLGLVVAIVYELAVGVLQYAGAGAIAGIALLYGLLCLFVVAAIGRYSTLTLSRILIATTWLVIPFGQFPLFYYFGKGLNMLLSHTAYQQSLRPARRTPSIEDRQMEAKILQQRAAEDDIENEVTRLREQSHTIESEVVQLRNQGTVTKE